MKKLLISIVGVLTTLNLYSQSTPEIGHFQQLETIKRGDTIDVAFYYKPDASTDIRTFQIDFQYRKQLFTHYQTTVDQSVNSMTPAISFKKWEGYKYSSYDTNTSSYSYVSDTNWTVGRNYLVLSSGSQIQSNGYVIHNKFIINDVQPNFVEDTVVVNWARMFKVDGTTIGDNVASLSYDKLDLELLGNLVISGKVWMGPQLNIMPKVVCTKFNTGEFVSESTLDSQGNYYLNNVDKNTKYKLTLRFPTDSLSVMRDYAVTITDAVKTFDEYVNTDVSQGTSHQYLKFGLSYLIGDVNKTGTLDGGDPYSIYASVSGLNLIDTNLLVNALHKSVYDSLVLGSNQWNDWSSYINGTNYIVDSVGTTNLSIDIKYFLLGDVDRTHSSPVYDGSGNLVQAAVYKGDFDVTIPDMTTGAGQPLFVPFNINTNGSINHGLQFEMKYDNTKVTFEEIISNFGEGPWLQYVTHDVAKSTIRFGGMNNMETGGLQGTATPFKIKFSPIGSNDITTNIYVRQLMDASDKNGDHLNIDLTSEITTLYYKMGPPMEVEDEVSVSIRPNPVTGWFEIEVYFPSEDMSLNANVYDNQGKHIKTIGKISGNGFTKIVYKQVDMSSQTNGHYYLVLTDNNKQITKHFIKIS